MWQTLHPTQETSKKWFWWGLVHFSISSWCNNLCICVGHARLATNCAGAATNGSIAKQARKIRALCSPTGEDYEWKLAPFSLNIFGAPYDRLLCRNRPPWEDRSSSYSYTLLKILHPLFGDVSSLCKFWIENEMNGVAFKIWNLKCSARFAAVFRETV